MCSGDFKFGRNIVYSCKDHLIWCLKYRRSMLVDASAVHLDEIICTVGGASLGVVKQYIGNKKRV